MIFQEPMSSLNPCFTVGFQIGESLKEHLGLSRQERKERTIALLRSVGITDAERRMRAFPHQLSGGMNQRVMIAMAIACSPKLIIADEPTTALDVTIQAQILDLLLALQRETGTALILITHDMGVVAETAERVAVFYSGQKVEEQGVRPLFADPHHPYTAALLAALPERATGRRLPSIPGVVPGAFNRPTGFRRAARTPPVKCVEKVPPRQLENLGYALCHYPLVGGRPFGHPDRFGEDTGFRMSDALVPLKDAPLPPKSGDIVMQAENLSRFYKVRLGPLRGAVTLKAVNGVSFSLAAGKTLAVGRRVRLRQVHAGADGDDDRAADGRPSAHRPASTSPATRARCCGASGAKSRSSFRIPTARSIRAKRSVRRSRSRSRSTGPTWTAGCAATRRWR